MSLTETQRQLVEDNMGLVGQVIKDRVRDIGNIGIYTYDDLFQIGCIGLCNAASTDSGSGARFSTYAYRLIQNQIFTALGYASLRKAREPVTDPALLPATGETDVSGTVELQADLGTALAESLKTATGVTAKGIKALRLMADGYTCREIGEQMGVPASHVTAWISKARKHLRALPEIQNLAYDLIW